MRVWLPLYVRRQGGLQELYTLGLGPLSTHGRGRHPARIKRTLADELQKTLLERPATVMKRFERRPGTKLERLRLELRLGRGRKRTGLFPLIVERLPDGGNVAVYHPLRQAEVMLSDLGRFREDAARFFADRWTDLDDEAIAALETDGKDRL